MAKQLTEADRKIIQRAMERFRICEESMAELRLDANKDDKFLAGEQWPSALKKQRDDTHRPCLVINKVKTYVKRVVNENRQNRPAIRLRPADDKDDPDTADVKNGLLKHIAYSSDAESAYDTAVFDAVRHGFGFFRVRTDYCDPESFDQDIFIERIKDAYSVWFPVHLCQRVDWADAPYLFITTDMTHEDFKAKFPDYNPQDWINSPDVKWITEKMVRVAEYFEMEETPVTLYRLADGTTTTVKPLDPALIIKERRSTKRTWQWYKLTSGAILERQEWPIKYHPVIPVIGEEMIVDGKLTLISLVRFARDPQRMFNYWRSCETEMIALAPRTPFIGAQGQFEGQEAKWKTANTANHAYLEYKAIVDATGNGVLPPPKRVDSPQIPMGYVNAAKEAGDDIKAVTGIFDASLGAQGNETSGKAILSRQRQSDVSNFDFADNLAKSLRQAGRIIVELLPIYYDTPRTVHIIGEDKEDKVVKVNEQYQKDGKPKFHDMSGGKYDVIVDVGPGYQSKREEATQSILELIRVFPPVAQVSGDIFVENLDFPGARDIAARLRKAIPPQLLESKENEAPTEQDVKAIVGDVEKLQLLNSKLMQMVQKLSNDSRDKDLDRQLKMDIALLQAETELHKTKIIKGTDVTRDMMDVMREKYSYANRMRQNTSQGEQVPAQPALQSQEQTMPVS
jgi:hypothetical protein